MAARRNITFPKLFGSETEINSAKITTIRITLPKIICVLCAFELLEKLDIPVTDIFQAVQIRSLGFRRVHSSKFVFRNNS